MSDFSHKGSLLPISNRVLAADGHTSFLAHYDLNENDVLHGIKPIGNRYALNFNGSNTRVETGFGNAYNTSHPFSVECWAFGRTFSGNRMVFGAPNGNNQRFYLGVNSGRWSMGIQGTLWDHSTAQPAAALNTWTHLCIVLNGSKATLYVNGEIGREINYTPYDLASFVTLGGSGYIWDGMISNFRTWGTALTQEQIKMNLVKQPEDLSSLLTDIKLDEGSGDIARDYSPSSSDGMIFNGSWTNGNSIFTLRPQEGYFGGGIVIEEGTTNLIPNAKTLSEVRTFTSGNGSFIDHGSYVANEEMYYHWEKTTTSNGDRRVRVAENININKNTDNVITVEIKPISSTATIEFYITGSVVNAHSANQRRVFFYSLTSGSVTTDVNCLLLSTTQLNDGYIRIAVRVSPDFYGTSTGEIGNIDVYHNWGNPYRSEYFIRKPQLEQKPFSTSFVNGTRPASNLIYPKEIVNPIEGTISCWIYIDPDGPHSASTGWGMPFTIVEIVATPYSERNQIGFRKYPNSREWRAYSSNNAGAASSATIGSPSKGWHMISMTWGNRTLKGYLDGELISTANNANLPSNFDNPTLGGLIVGRWTSGNHINTIMDELRIDRIQRTDEEIAAWYHSNSPFWPRGIYRKSY